MSYNNDKTTTAIAIAIVAVGVIVLFSISMAITTALVYYIWNLAISPVFDLQQITLLQALLFGFLLNMVRSAITINNRSND